MHTWSVLVVDDEANYRSLLSVLIESDPRLTLFGTAENGQTALETVEQRCPDAIILDVRMPVLDGMTALPTLRTRCPDSVIVMYSSDPQAAAEAERRGANLVMDKATAAVLLLDHLVELCCPA